MSNNKNSGDKDEKSEKKERKVKERNEAKFQQKFYFSGGILYSKQRAQPLTSTSTSLTNNININNLTGQENQHHQHQHQHQVGYQHLHGNQQTANSSNWSLTDRTLIIDVDDHKNNDDYHNHNNNNHNHNNNNNTGNVNIDNHRNNANNERKQTSIMEQLNHINLNPIFNSNPHFNIHSSIPPKTSLHCSLNQSLLNHSNNDDDHHHQHPKRNDRRYQPYSLPSYSNSSSFPSSSSSSSLSLSSLSLSNPRSLLNNEEIVDKHEISDMNQNHRQLAEHLLSFSQFDVPNSQIVPRFKLQNNYSFDHENEEENTFSQPTLSHHRRDGEYVNHKLIKMEKHAANEIRSSPPILNDKLIINEISNVVLENNDESSPNSPSSNKFQQNSIIANKNVNLSKSTNIFSQPISSPVYPSDEQGGTNKMSFSFICR